MAEPFKADLAPVPASRIDMKRKTDLSWRLTEDGRHPILNAVDIGGKHIEITMASGVEITFSATQVDALMEVFPDWKRHRDQAE